MKRISTLLPVLLCVAFQSLAQRNLQPGYIINNSGDTINGFVDYKEWYRNPNSVSFTETKEDAPVKYSVSDVQEFNITGKEQYKRFLVQISMDKQALSDIGTKDTSYRQEQVYLKVLYASKILQLFSYNDDLKSRLYILTQDIPVPIELQHTKYMLNGDVINVGEYRNILLGIANKYAPGNTKLADKIAAQEYFVTDILKICYEISGEEKPKMQNINTQKSSKIRLYVSGGVGISLFTVGGRDKYHGNLNKGNISPLFAAGGDLLFNPYTGRLFLRTNISYSSYKTNAYVYNELFTWNDNYYLRFRQTNFTITESINFNLYNGTALKYFLGIGPGFNFSSYPLNEETLVREKPTETVTTVNNAYFENLNKFWINGVINTGFIFKSVELSASYTTKVSLAKESIGNSSLNVRLAYFFKR